MAIFRFLLPLLLTLALGACAQHASTANDAAHPLEGALADLGYRAGDETTQILGFDLSHWRYIDQQHLLLPGEGKAAWLIALEEPCDNLAQANRLAYRGRSAALTPRDQLVSFDTQDGIRVCQIHSIRTLERIRRG